MLERHLPAGPLALADLGYGDGPLFAALERGGFIAPSRPVYAVDLAPTRLRRVAARFPWIETVLSPAEAVPQIGDGALDFVISTMVLEHVPNERAYLAEIERILHPGGRAYVTTVFKKRWAWYFRKRNGESVLDPSHLREYTDVDVVRGLVGEAGFRIVALERRCSGSRSSIRSSSGQADPWPRGERSSVRSARRRSRSPGTTACGSSSSALFDSGTTSLLG